MSPELATALARETLDAIRRASAPLLARIAALEAASLEAAEALRLAARDAQGARDAARAMEAAVEARVAAAVAAALETLRADVEKLRGPPGEGFRYREVFDRDADYDVGDWITHDGTLWAARAPSKGLVPGTEAAAAAWRMAMKRARDGANGIGMNWRGAYAHGETYRVNDVVREAGRVFVCRRATSNAPPLPGGAVASEWSLMLEA
jgi:hypothetical protein